MRVQPSLFILVLSPPTKDAPMNDETVVLARDLFDDPVEIICGEPSTSKPSKGQGSGRRERELQLALELVPVE